MRPSIWRALLSPSEFQSTHPSRGATGGRGAIRAHPQVSIHAPLAGCDAEHRRDDMHADVSIHAPLAGCDYPVWGRCIRGSVSIHAPLAGCDSNGDDGARCREVSIHAPLAGCDGILPPLRPPAPGFNPRTPRGVRPAGICDIGGLPVCFNPRTPRGVRHHQTNCRARRPCFNPRTPRGVRLLNNVYDGRKTQFQSTHPSRGATRGAESLFPSVHVSIHAPLAGCDEGLLT